MQVKVFELPTFWKTTSFRLTVIVASSFSVAAILLIGVVYWQINTALTRDIAIRVQTEAAQLLSLARRLPPETLIEQIDLYGRIDDRRFYLLISEKSGRQAGNLETWPSNITGLGEITVARLPIKGGQQRLVVGMSLRVDAQRRLLIAHEARAISDLGRQIARWIFVGTTAMALIGVLLGFALSRLVLGRLYLITQTSERIMSGDLSERVPQSGSDDEFDSLAHNLNRMLQRIEDLMAGLRDVSDNIAHDLKTPLNRLRNRAEDALNGSCNAHDSLEQIVAEADDLIRTFNALLQIARLEAGASDDDRERMNFTEFVGDIVELYTPVVEEAQSSIAFINSGPVVFDGNRQLLAQALMNLIENALKYGKARTKNGTHEKGADICVGLSHCADELVLSVSDRGAGIPEDQYERALKRFGRLDASRSLPGTGLGLSLVHVVAKIHGGRLELDNNKPGLIVSMRLPLTGAGVSPMPL